MRAILVPLDGSPLSESALPIASGLAQGSRAELVLVRAVLARGLEALDPEVQLDLEGEAEAYLVRVAGGLQTAGLDAVRWHVVYGQPDQAIADAAARHRVDLIVMATHGRSGIMRLLLGSVAERVLREVTLPVVLARGEPALRRGRDKVLVPLDGSPLSEAILPLAEQLGRALGLGIILLGAREPLPLDVAAEAISRATVAQGLREGETVDYLARIGETLTRAGLRVQTVVRSGLPAEVIQDVALSEKVALIAMTTHGRTGWGRLPIGSAARSVLRASTVPVLLCRPARAPHA